MYTLHKSIIAFLLFFTTTILACPPPQNENASQWGFGPDDISIENIISARSPCPANVWFLVTFDAIEISFDSSPYVDVGPGLSPDRATWLCFVNFNLKSPKSWKPVFERVRYGVDYSLDDNVSSNQDTFVYIGPGPADHQIQSPNFGPSSGSFCLDDLLGPSVAGSCGPEKTPVGVRIRLTIDNSGNTNGFGFLQVNSPYYLGLHWEFCP
ncbi:hypothetical protein BDZ91DRAFT_765203 [Kalaharituber pfeilii]|nr:hypothetical protein BDZ91DRAFT_765203 [Kalaharituber pfeilii]